MYILHNIVLVNDISECQRITARFITHTPLFTETFESRQ